MGSLSQNASQNQLWTSQVGEHTVIRGMPGQLQATIAQTEPPTAPTCCCRVCPEVDLQLLEVTNRQVVVLPRVSGLAVTWGSRNVLVGIGMTYMYVKLCSATKLLVVLPMLYFLSMDAW